MNAQSGQQKLNLGCQKELRNQLEIAGLEMTMKSVRIGTHLKSWRDRVPDFRSCNAEAAGKK